MGKHTVQNEQIQEEHEALQESFPWRECYLNDQTFARFSSQSRVREGQPRLSSRVRSLSFHSTPPLNSCGVGLFRVLKFVRLCFLICEMGIIIALLACCEAQGENPCIQHPSPLTVK